MKRLKRKIKLKRFGCKFHPDYQGLKPPTSKNKLCTCKEIFEARKKAVEIKTVEETVIVREKKRGDNFTIHGSTSRLQEGMVIFHGGAEYVVEMVNECRARCRPLNTQKKEITFTNAKGKTFSFKPELVGATINISPNSECEILRWQRAA
jgi:hypothetical protein